MKKGFLLFNIALVFAFSTTINAQKSLKPKTTEEIESAFCHTWRLTGTDQNGLRLPPPLKVDFTRLVLKSDGSCTKTSGGEEIPCQWQYKPKTMVLLIQDKDGTSLYMLMKITDSEFMYKTKIAGYYMNMVFQKEDE